MRKTLLLVLLGSLSNFTFGQQFLGSPSYKEPRKLDDNVGVFAGLGVNATGGFVEVGEGVTNSAKGALSLLPSIGLFYQKGITSKLSVRISVMLGSNSYAYKYAQPFDSMRNDGVPTTSSKFKTYERVKNRSSFAIPQIDIGYLSDPFKEMYIIEVRAGFGIHTYLSQSDDSLHVSKVARLKYNKSNEVLSYYSTEKANYGEPDVYGNYVGTLYAGLRWQKTFSNLLNHSSLGIQAIIPVNTDKAGYSEIEYKSSSNYRFGSERVKMSLLSFGIRYTYNFL